LSSDHRSRLEAHPGAARVKRCADVFVSLAALLVLLPLLLLVGLAVRLSLGKPIIFRQPRIGLSGKVFYLFKFRTMTEERDISGRVLPDDQRLTTLGRLIRSLSLDELPQFFNVLKGEMSLVGPRPLLVEYRDLYTVEQWRRHLAPPGLVGPVTAYGRNSLSWETKFELDCWYVDNWSLRLDIRLFALSVWRAGRRSGVNAENSATMPRFQGSTRQLDEETDDPSDR